MKSGITKETVAVVAAAAAEEEEQQQQQQQKKPTHPPQKNTIRKRSKGRCTWRKKAEEYILHY